MYGYPCHYCDGTVQPKDVALEGFEPERSFILLEDS